MQLAKISPKRQITIPQEAFKKLQLEVGEFLVEITEGGLLLIPQKVISKDQTWFWTKEWQTKEREADEAIAKGDLSGPFESGSALLSHLKKHECKFKPQVLLTKITNHYRNSSGFKSKNNS